jgi:hypothetical protein
MQPCRKSSFIKGARCQRQDGLGGILFARLEVEAMKFHEENTDHKPSAFVAIDERMIADYASGVECGHRDDVRRSAIGMVLAGTRKSRLPKTKIAQTHRSAVERQKAVVDRKYVALVKPKWFLLFHFLFTLKASAACCGSAT